MSTNPIPCSQCREKPAVGVLYGKRPPYIDPVSGMEVVPPEIKIGSICAEHLAINGGSAEIQEGLITRIEYFSEGPIERKG